ncbi:conserved exported hypothetical protein [Candidatus Propionivibrio aalborgensis]|uniref:Cytochrome c7-like domain-containing protein n=1 Tax=Candidatus Propionivibrio aalborgensis TaxID=1860101 RepID=A0A1A8XSC7_9RHOO|nr:hypothetical protein [Candidatus Propionivibrio aalborgensis]SBT06838.1 conserved exported hypothetical protein [Candidatus Propionivibrio aalborgensis]
MKKLAIYSVVVALCGSTLYAVFAAEKPAAAKEAAAQAEPAKEEAAKEPLVCFESRKGASEITQKDVKPGWPNVKCSPTTGAALWYGDPFDSTVPKDKRPAPIPTMAAMVPDLANFEHGRGRIWCMDCHHTTQRNKLVDHFGDPISFDQPQLLCGKCHGDKLRDWRDGIHGKRIGEFTSTGKKRWFTCTECHNPHNVQDGARNRGFVKLQPEPPPQLSRGMKDAGHEKLHPIPH